MSEPQELYLFPADIRAATSRDHAALEGIEDPFVRSAEISSNRLDAYFTRMDPKTTLANYARDAAAGVSVLDSHDARKLAVGYSFTGDVREGDDGAIIVLSDWYTIRGLAFGGNHSYATTDDYIKAVEARLVRKISVGFYGGRQICDICRQNYYSWDCPHIGGVEYEIKGEDGQARVVATSTIFDANLAEYSLVFKGATPGAALRKVERELKEGRLTREHAAMLESRYRIKLPEPPKSTAGVDYRSKKTMDYEKLYIDARAAATEVIGEEAEPAAAIRQLASEVERLRPLADDGRAYRADLINDALAEGVRANGEEFAEESYRGILERADIATIKRMRDDWKRLGDKRFQGGASTVVEDETPDPAATRGPALVPDEAYRV